MAAERVGPGLSFCSGQSWWFFPVVIGSSTVLSHSCWELSVCWSFCYQILCYFSLTCSVAGQLLDSCCEQSSSRDSGGACPEGASGGKDFLVAYRDACSWVYIVVCMHIGI